MDAHTPYHPSLETLQAYGLGTLDDAMAQTVQEHLEACPDCRRQVADISSDGFLDRLRDAQRGPKTLGPGPTRPEGGQTDQVRTDAVPAPIRIRWQSVGMQLIPRP